MTDLARPEIRRFLEQIEELAEPALAELDVTTARARMIASCRELWGEPEPVAHVEDVHCGDVVVRSYRPTLATLPGIVYLHGGGFVVGSVETHDGLCRRLANLACCAVFSVEYRLAPEHPFPAAVDDAVSAAAFLHEHASVFAVDPARLSIAGDSAGGNLAAVAARALAQRGVRLSSQVLLYPVTAGTTDSPSYDEHAEGAFLTRRDMQWYLDHYAGGLADRDHPDLAPLHAGDLRGLPPAYIATCELDPLRADGTRYAERLREDGVSVVLEDWPGMIHGFLLMRTVTAAADELLDHVADFLEAGWDASAIASLADPSRASASRG